MDVPEKQTEQTFFSLHIMYRHPGACAFFYIWLWQPKRNFLLAGKHIGGKKWII